MSKQERVVCAAIRRVGKGYLDRLSECIDICLQYDDEYSTANYHSERDVGIEFHEEVKASSQIRIDSLIQPRRFV